MMAIAREKGSDIVWGAGTYSCNSKIKSQKDEQTQMYVKHLSLTNVVSGIPINYKTLTFIIKRTIKI